MSGFLARFLVFEGENHVPYPNEEGGSLDIPSGIISLLDRINTGATAGGHITFPMAESPITRPVPYRVQYAPDGAEQFALELGIAQADSQNATKGKPINSIIARTVEQIQKLALIKAVANYPEGPSIRLVDLKWAKLVHDEIVRNMARQIDESIADNDHEAALNKVKKAVKHYTDEAEACSLSNLARACQSIPSRLRNDLIGQLVDMGDVEPIMVPIKAGRPAQYYRWIGE